MQGFSRYLVMPMLVLVVGIALVQAGEVASSARPVLPKSLSHVVFVGVDGSSCEKAVVIKNAADHFEGVKAEKAWIAWKYPKASLKEQSVSGAGDKTFDTLEIKTASGESKTVCFDITDFFGQW